MIFVPSVDGVSHSPREHTEPEHLVARRPGPRSTRSSRSTAARPSARRGVSEPTRAGATRRPGPTTRRDLVGYGADPPDPHWPGGARVAVSFVLNVEEGGENSVLHGDPASETFLSEIVGAQPFPDRHLSMESLYEYGSRGRRLARAAACSPTAACR